ncbi:hypothetical protein BKA70DRAFT_1276696 [Coprinopsis sp. MPI-PUGE-AT-0042]|nr:hypothetical protein BKA70DRAFT_1276696 [Coprinopsis sp. MPI-PUGE-AT-0042]
MSTSVTSAMQDEVNGPWKPITLPSYPLTALLSDDFGANIAGEMCLVHNVIIRSLGSVWRHAPLVTAKDLPAFTCYSKAALEMLHEHHHTEEEIFFPILAKEGLAGMVEGNVEQHKAFHEAMGVLNEYLEALEKNPSQYDAGKLRELLQDLGNPLVSHLHDEIATIQPEVMQKVDKKALQKVSQDLEAHIKSQGGFTTMIPFMLSAHSSEEAPNWPPLPGPLRWVTKNVFARVHSSWWRFAPFDMSGKPQTYTPAQ